MIRRKADLSLALCLCFSISIQFVTSANSDTNSSVKINNPPQVLQSMFNVQVHHRPISFRASPPDSTNSLKSDKVVLTTNIDEPSSFKVQFAKPLTEAIEVSFTCDGSKGCTTFRGPLPSVLLNVSETSAEVHFTATTAGHDDVSFHVSGNTSVIDLKDATIRFRVRRSEFLDILSQVFGWVYFFGWSISFWPQNISNYRRKSVVGLNFDYTLLHFTGMVFYSIFNCVLYFSIHVQEEYEAIHIRSEIPVELNDVVYALHAAFATSITWTQCMTYEAGDQRLSLPSKIFQAFVWIVGTALAFTAMFQVTRWIDFIYFFSYIKLLVTAVKYLPQLIFNFRRKSTKGWSIYMIYLDITGGTMSMFQMITIAYNFNDWQTLVGNFPKLGLAIASMFYDVLFLLQEFVFYPGTNKEDKGDAKCKLSSAEIGQTQLKRESKVSLGPYPTYGTRNGVTNGNLNISNNSIDNDNDNNDNNNNNNDSGYSINTNKLTN